MEEHDDDRGGGRGFSLRAKLPELVVEGASVAFAVLLALAVDEWREDRSNRELAEQAEQSILAEVRGNRDRLLEKDRERDSLVAYTRTVRKSLVDGEEPDSITINVNPALLTRTAWETAQITRALHFIQYERVASIGRLYEFQTLYEDTEDVLVRMLAGLETLDWDEPVDALDTLLPVLIRVDTFADLLATIYDSVLEDGLDTLGSDSASVPRPTEALPPDAGSADPVGGSR